MARRLDPRPALCGRWPASHWRGRWRFVVAGRSRRCSSSLALMSIRMLAGVGGTLNSAAGVLGGVLLLFYGLGAFASERRSIWMLALAVVITSLNCFDEARRGGLGRGADGGVRRAVAIRARPHGARASRARARVSRCRRAARR